MHLVKNIGSNDISRFKQFEKIGDGAYGDVYKATDENGQVFALKKMRITIENEGMPSTVIREISILREFSHPNIVQLIDIII